MFLRRFVYISGAVRFFINVKPIDVIYTALPFYHSASGIITISQCVLHGNTVAIRSKFSASKFWEDCIKYKCTVSHYIGEMCRFLLAQPDKPTDRQHQVRVMYGNGLRPQIWTQFTQRFSIDTVAEFYGSTEGNANVVNFPGKVGACGFVPVIVPSKYPVTLIKVDPETREPVRDKEGLCQLCKPGRIGQIPILD
ncbi:SLC27A4 [Cordylochernes scorpioides]|uniref:Long-chain-fatty-acid--CoA ligase n=1 Tax=Cordylochernes scorpioides TaxID=51811 RepID=A0ABY6JZC7_9ARAC|nr:SLC27A4 [Cordylochernes scorpioides]